MAKSLFLKFNSYLHVHKLYPPLSKAYYFSTSEELIEYCCKQQVKDVYLICRHHANFNDYALLIDSKIKLQVFVTSGGEYPCLRSYIAEEIIPFFIADEVEVRHLNALGGSKWNLVSKLNVRELAKFLKFFDLFIREICFRNQ